MAHNILNYEKSYYLIQCYFCNKQWRKHKRYVKLKFDEHIHQYVAAASDICPACQNENTLVSTVSRWALWKKIKPLFKPYQTEIQCKFGTIATIRFSLVEAIAAKGTSAPYLIASHARPILVGGEFYTSSLWSISLAHDCVLSDGRYTLKSIDVIVSCNQILLYTLENLSVRDRNALVSVKEEADCGVLAPNVTFTALLTYIDPIWAKP